MIFSNLLFDSTLARLGDERRVGDSALAEGEGVS